MLREKLLVLNSILEKKGFKLKRPKFLPLETSKKRAKIKLIANITKEILKIITEINGTENKRQWKKHN